MSRMQVVKRGKKYLVFPLHVTQPWYSLLDGRKEKVMFDKITSRISKLCYGLNQDYVDPVCCLEEHLLNALFCPVFLLVALGGNHHEGDIRSVQRSNHGGT